MTVLDRSFARLLGIALSIALLAAWLAACTAASVHADVPYTADDPFFISHERNPT